MEHYRCHKAYIPNKRVERISDTIEFYPKKFNTPKMSSIDATIHAAQDLIYSIQNPAPEISPEKLGNGQKKALRTLEEIFRKATPLETPPRVPVREVVQ